jgi:hypothetical protein
MIFYHINTEYVMYVLWNYCTDAQQNICALLWRRIYLVYMFITHNAQGMGINKAVTVFVLCIGLVA